MQKYMLNTLTAVSSTLALVFGWTFINRAQLPYNTEDNYFDEHSFVIYHQQAIISYGLLFSLTVFVTIVLAILAKKAPVNNA